MFSIARVRLDSDEFDLTCEASGSKRKDFAMNRPMLVFLASLVLLTSAFAAVPWKEMTDRGISGYDDIFSSYP